MDRRILAGVVTYNPDISRLIECLSSIEKQVGQLLVVDNASDNRSKIMETVPECIKNKIVFIHNPDNMGIAAALRQIMDYAQEKRYDWVFTMDQDSVLESGLIDRYISLIDDEEFQNTGIFTCLIRDRNFSDLNNEKQKTDVEEVDFCITSGALTNVEKYLKTTGYDASFFIDGVDFDISYAIREQGYHIHRVNYMGIYHEVGNGENRKFFDKKIVIYHHKPFRIYYMARNTIWLNKRHKNANNFSKVF